MNPAPSDLLVHRGPMLLLDEIIHCDNQRLRAVIDIGAHKMFCDDEGAPGWVGIEWLAQTAGAWLGAYQRDRGRPVNMGFLLGTRRYDSPARFAPGRIYADAEPQLLDEATGMAVIDATLRAPRDEARLAGARIKLFQPADVAVFFENVKTSP